MLFKQFLNCPNIIYSIVEIKKPEYKKLDVFISSIGSLSTILKTIIFVNIINEKMVLTKYLHTKLSDNLKNKTKQVI